MAENSPDPVIDVLDIEVSFTEEQLSKFRELIDNEVREHAEADGLERQLDLIDATYKASRLATTWGSPSEEPTAGLSYRSIVQNLKERRAHDDDVINTAEWGLEFDARAEVKTAEGEVKSVERLMIDGIHRATRRVLVSGVVQEHEEEPQDDEPDNLTGFMLNPNAIDQTTKGYVVRNENDQSAFKHLSHHLVETES